MKILLTNDDGILAPGIAAMYRALTQLGEVYVVAPDSAQSASAHAITVQKPIAVSRIHVHNEFYGHSVGGLPADWGHTVNRPDLPLAKIKGLKITRLAHPTHIDTVEEGHDGRREYYWLVRQKLDTDTDKGTDIWTLEQDSISITALNTTMFQKSTSGITDNLCSDLFRKLKQA